MKRYRITPEGAWRTSVIGDLLHSQNASLTLCALSASNPQGASNMNREFVAFLKEYGVIGLAIAVIIGGKLNDLVTAIVQGILMPVIGFFVPNGAWRTATLDIGSVHLLVGPVAGAAIDFLIVAWLVFWFSKKILREEQVTKK